jgi:TonB family protein
MMWEVSDVLRDRGHEPAGLERMAVVSVALHALLVGLLAFGSGRWLSREVAVPATVMTITLGGAAGPQTGGTEQAGGRPVQAETPPAEPVRRAAVRPPAARTPDMTLPRARTRPARPAPPRVAEAPDDARGLTPTEGTETSPGSAPAAAPGTRGRGFGLSSGGASLGSSLDVADFCCPDFILLMTDLIRRSWNPAAEVDGQAIIKFAIQRDGRITDVALEKSSGFAALDLNAQRAVVMTRQLPPLPTAFPNPTLTVHLNFQYRR